MQQTNTKIKQNSRGICSFKTQFLSPVRSSILSSRQLLSPLSSQQLPGAVVLGGKGGGWGRGLATRGQPQDISQGPSRMSFRRAHSFLKILGSPSMPFFWFICLCVCLGLFWFRVFGFVCISFFFLFVCFYSFSLFPPFHWCGPLCLSVCPFQ